MCDPARLHKLQSCGQQDEKEAMAKKLSKASYMCRLRGGGITLVKIMSKKQGSERESKLAE